MINSDMLVTTRLLISNIWMDFRRITTIYCIFAFDVKTEVSITHPNQLPCQIFTVRLVNNNNNSNNSNSINNNKKNLDDADDLGLKQQLFFFNILLLLTLTHTHRHNTLIKTIDIKLLKLLKSPKNIFQQFC